MIKKIAREIERFGEIFCASVAEPHLLISGTSGFTLPHDKSHYLCERQSQATDN